MITLPIVSSLNIYSLSKTDNRSNKVVDGRPVDKNTAEKISFAKDWYFSNCGIFTLDYNGAQYPSGNGGYSKTLGPGIVEQGSVTITPPVIELVRYVGSANAGSYRADFQTGIIYTLDISGNITGQLPPPTSSSTTTEIQQYRQAIYDLTEGIHNVENYGSGIIIDQFTDVADLQSVYAFLNCVASEVSAFMPKILNSDMDPCFAGCGDIEPHSQIEYWEPWAYGDGYRFSLEQNGSNQYEIYTAIYPGGGASGWEGKINLSTGELWYLVSGSPSITLPNPNICTPSQLSTYYSQINSYMIPIIGAIKGNTGSYELQQYIDFLNCMQSNIPVAVNDISKGVDVSVIVYPNPAQSEATIQLPKAADEDINVTIFNDLGQAVQTLTIAKGQDSIKVNLADVSNGVYAYSLMLDNNPVSGKIVVNK